jgi:hypothetical protein
VERVGEEGVLDVGGDQFLVLLLVFQAEDDAADGFGVGRVFGLSAKQLDDGGVDVGAVGEDVGDGRAGEAGAKRFGGHVAQGVVVGVEEPVEVGMEVLVSGEEVAQDKGLKEPRGVGEVPLGGAGLRRGLDHQILRRERGGERKRGGADGAVAVQQSRGSTGGA